MLVPTRYVARPTVDQTRTRRPLSGLLAHGLTTSALYAYLTRTRPCVTHQVEGAVQPWDGAAPFSLPNFVRRVVRVRVPVSDRGALLGAAIAYRAEGDAAITVELHDQADAAAVLDSSTIQVQGTGYLVAGPQINYRIEEVTTSGAVFPAQPRLLAVPAGNRGTTCVIRIVPPAAGTRVQICSVSVYEIAADLETP